MVIDCSNIGIGNVDVDLLKFIVTSFSRYYPKLFDTILIHQLPFLLQYLFKLVQTWLPEDDRKFFHMSTRKTLTNFIATEQLPPFLLTSEDNSSEKQEANRFWQNWRRSTSGGDQLPAKQFIERFGSKFGLKFGDSEKLNFLKEQFI